MRVTLTIDDEYLTVSVRSQIASLLASKLFAIMWDECGDQWDDDIRKVARGIAIASASQIGVSDFPDTSAYAEAERNAAAASEQPASVK